MMNHLKKMDYAFLWIGCSRDLTKERAHLDLWLKDID